MNETADEGAAREAWEEARAKLKIDQLLAIYSIPQISQVQIIYRAKLSKPEVSAGPESQAVALFDRDDIPWRDLAFPTVEWALNQHYSVQEKSTFPPFSNPLEV